LVEQVTDEKAWDEYVRTKARDSRGGMRSALSQILQLYRPMWQFATMIQEVEMGEEDVAEDVDVSPIWSMLLIRWDRLCSEEDRLGEITSGSYKSLG
jgi:hypothetical protein